MHRALRPPARFRSAVPLRLAAATSRAGEKRPARRNRHSAGGTCSSCAPPVCDKRPGSPRRCAYRAPDPPAGHLPSHMRTHAIAGLLGARAAALRLRRARASAAWTAIDTCLRAARPTAAGLTGVCARRLKARPPGRKSRASCEPSGLSRGFRRAHSAHANRVARPWDDRGCPPAKRPETPLPRQDEINQIY